MPPVAPPSHRFAVLRLVAPPLLAIGLFAAAVWLLIIPATTEALLERKRETLRAIVASALSLCERHHAAEVAGTLDRATAQAQAAADLRAITTSAMAWLPLSRWFHSIPSVCRA